MKTIIAVLIFILVSVFVSCAKEVPALVKQSGTPVWLISYKYTLDTVLLKKDTLWHDPNLPDKELLKIKAAAPLTWILFCDPPVPALPGFILEKRLFVIGKNSH